MRRGVDALLLAEEARLGADAAPQFTEEFGGPVRDAELQEYVTRIGMKMARTTEGEFPKLDWEFTLLDSDVINAFALPGGKVFITRGLASKMTSEAQMLEVLHALHTKAGVRGVFTDWAGTVSYYANCFGL